MRNNGETNPVTYLILALVAAGGFYAYHVAPLYFGNLEVKEAATEAFNVYLQKGDKAATDALLVRLNGKNPDVTHLETDEDGVEVEKPGFGLTEDNVKITFDETTRHLTVHIEYDRIVQFKPLKKRKMYHLVAEKTGTLAK